MSDIALHGPATSGRSALSNLLSKTVLYPPVASVEVLLILWLVATRFVPTEVLPYPWTVVEEMITHVFGKPGWVMDIVMTLQRILAGWVVALLFGTIIGVLMGSKRFLNSVLRDYVIVFLSMPILVWALMGVLWFGGSILAAVAAGALAAFASASINVYEGVTNVDKGLIDMARVYRLSRWSVLRRIIIPSMIPFMLASARQAFAADWKTIAILEVFGASVGIGFQLRDSYERNAIEGIIAWVIVFIGIMLLIENGIFGQIQRYLLRWRPEIGEVS